MVLAIMGVLVATAIPNFSGFTQRGYDESAESDYRNIKVAVYNAVAEPGSPDTFSFTRVMGPQNLPAPLTAVRLSKDTEATVFHQTRLSRGAAPATTTRITVQNFRGTKIYSYTEINGVITEQVTVH